MEAKKQANGPGWHRYLAWKMERKTAKLITVTLLTLLLAFIW
jgi:hypothetical protein